MQIEFGQISPSALSTRDLGTRLVGVWRQSPFQVEIIIILHLDICTQSYSLISSKCSAILQSECQISFKSMLSIPLGQQINLLLSLLLSFCSVSFQWQILTLSWGGGGGS